MLAVRFDGSGGEGEGEGSGYEGTFMVYWGESVLLHAAKKLVARREKK